MKLEMTIIMLEERKHPALSGLALIMLAIMVMVASVSCKSHKKPLPVEIPETFSLSGEASMPDKWWEAFNDADLNQIEEEALADNLDILSAWDRLEQASAIAKMRGAELWPNVTGTVGISDTDVFGKYADGPRFRGVERNTVYNWSLKASYEVDLWGRVRSSRKAAKMDFAASRQDLHSMAMTISGNVARLWYELVEQRLQQNLHKEQIKVSETFLELLELRFNHGLAPAADVLQQRQQTASIKGEMSLVNMRLQVTENQLAVLMGRHPKAGVDIAGGALPDLPPLPATGLPADLIKTRPDVQAAYLRVQAADYRVSEAIANRFPTLSLSATARNEDTKIEDLFDNWLGTIAGNLLIPIFEGGRRKQEVKRTRALASALLHQYGKTVLKAFGEVEDALVKEARQKEYLDSLDKQVIIAKQTVESTRDRYLNGATTYLPVLTALGTLQRLERVQLEAERSLVSYRIDLYRALGGAWNLQQRNDATFEPTKKETGDDE